MGKKQPLFIKITIVIASLLIISTLGKFKFNIFEGKHYGNGLIEISYPLESTMISSPLTVTGKARGNWYFEATFPVVVVNWDGLIIGEGYAQARGDWMTTDFVLFEGTVNFNNPVFAGTDKSHFSRRGWVIFKKDNPSGLPEHDDAIEVPILFKEKK